MSALPKARINPLTFQLNFSEIRIYAIGSPDLARCIPVGLILSGPLELLFSPRRKMDISEQHGASIAFL